MSDKTIKFVKNCNSHVAYTSYSRSGNTFLRTYIENLTQTFTGSTADLNCALHLALQLCGFSGESMTNPNVWIVKTHFPLGNEPKLNARKVICCVRNPQDVVASMFNFWATFTHSKSI